jgi:hypothetical protein
MIRPQLFRTVDDPYLRKMLVQAVHHRHRVRIDDDFSNLRNGEQRFNNMLEQRLVSQNAIVLASHTLAVMTHRNKGN